MNLPLENQVKYVKLGSTVHFFLQTSLRTWVEPRSSRDLRCTTFSPRAYQIHIQMDIEIPTR